MPQSIDISGVTTTADALSAALYHLSHPENLSHQERLRTELQGNGILPGSSLTLGQAKKVNYLECIIRETLRLNPPIPDGLARTLPSQDRIEVHGRTITGDVSSNYSLWVAHSLTMI